jgi:MEDS: MEthanogen/methylotroph, DcmR Sensory domain/Histidine kinase-, DNA gyrase B-, and HSP90-like ATPase/His Kinase A (phospho-acceptor) domain
MAFEPFAASRLVNDERFRALKQGDHVCAVYDSVDEQLEAMVDYIKSGLAQGERCVYIFGDRADEQILQGLSHAGVDVGAAVASQRLTFATDRETYLRDGSFDPERMIDFVRSSEKAALAEGCTGLRINGEMVWALGPEIGCDRIIEYETRLNEYFPGSHSHAICQYNRSRFSPAVIRDVLRTHPIAIVGQSVCPNPYYEPPHLALAGSDARERVEWMIGQLLDARRHELALQVAVRERDEFLSVASHELRTPLHALALSLHALQRQAAATDGGTYITRAQRQVDRMNRLVGTLLDVSRLREGRLEWHLGTVDLLALAHETAQQFEVEASHAGTSIQVHGSSTAGTFDAARIGQIGDSKPIEVEVGGDATFAQLTVTDRGVGIAPAEQKHIFERFGRASSAQHYAGMGLGLWIVKMLVEAMHGTIAVESAEGAGARFCVRLPLVATRHSKGYDA